MNFSEKDCAKSTYRFCGGKEPCIAAGYKVSPYMHDFYDFQYCSRGGFTLFINDRPHEIEAGMLYCVPPHVKVHKQFNADQSSSFFVGVKYDGLEAVFHQLGVSRENPVFSQPLSDSAISRLEELLHSLPVYSVVTVEHLGPASCHVEFMHQSYTMQQEEFYRQIGLFNLFLSELFRQYGSVHVQENDCRLTVRQKYIEKAVKYIENNLQYPITVNDVAVHVGLNRSYFYSLFKQEVGMSVQEFLIETRMKTACRFLCQKDVQIKTVAASVGYEPIPFAHVFKKKIKMSPTEYRDSHR